MDIYRKKAPGLYVEGPCHNQNCSAQDSLVTVNLGFGEFDLCRIILNLFVACPLCKQKIEPIRYGFTQCKWRNIDHYSTISYPSFYAKDEDISLKLNCVYEVIEVMPLSTDHEDDTRLSIINTLQSTQAENIYSPDPC